MEKIALMLFLRRIRKKGFVFRLVKIFSELPITEDLTHG
jgi:hypothetical protein